MKRLGSVILTIVLLCTLLLSVVPTAAVAANGATFTVSETLGTIGDVIAVDVAVSPSSYLVNADFILHYDRAVLQVVGFTPSALVGDLAEGNVIADGEYVIAYASAADTGIEEAGTLFTVQFKALRTTDAPSPITLSFDSCDAAKDGESFALTPTVVDGAVSVYPKKAPSYNKVFTDVPASAVPDRMMAGEQITVGLTPSKTAVKAGDEITMDFHVSANHYMVTCNIDFLFDPTVLELVEVNPDNADCQYVTAFNNKILPSAMCIFKMNAPGKARLVAASMATKGRTDAGIFFSLKFKVLDGWYGQTAVEVAVTEMVSQQVPSHDEAYNTNIVVNNAILDGGVEGDINQDGMVNIADAVAVFRGVNGRLILNELETLCAEINDDDTVNIADATALFRFVNGRTDRL